MKLCKTCLKDFGIEVRMYSAEAQLHKDAFPRHVIVDEIDYEKKGSK